MTATIYYEKDADPKALAGKTIAIIGYGSQGHAHAQNLRDSGNQVLVGLQAGSRSWGKALTDGFDVREVTDAARKADVVAVLAPDPSHRGIWEQIAPSMGKGRTLVVAHAFSVHFKEITPSGDIDVVLVAPKAPGHRMREVYKEGKGVPSLVAVHQDASGTALATALAYAHGLGSARAGILMTTFAEEVETDLFGEQAVLCGGISELVKAGFETLVEAGYQPEIAYFECLNELKLIVDLMYEGGIGKQRWSVSDTAEYGDLTRGPRVVNSAVKDEMRKILAEIQDGTFAREWVAEDDNGRPTFTKLQSEGEQHSIEQVGSKLRGLMSWVDHL